MTLSTTINIQKFSVHDGPGIRTTIFFKGCPLNCWWCHNPESQNIKHEILFFKERCTGCGICVKRCPEKAIEIRGEYPVTDKDKCILCGKCSDFCPSTAKEYVGKDISVKEIMKEIMKDQVFYEESGGGVTFSGGEPMMHKDFLNEVLKACKTRGIHTVIDTSGQAAFDSFDEVKDKVDLFLYDIKMMDTEKHKKYTGVGNEIILENLKRLSEVGANLLVRIPIVAGINDDDLNIDESVTYLSKLNIIEVNLLPYHKMGMDKYKRLDMKYKLSGMEKPSDTRMEEIKEKFNKVGIKVKIGG